MLKPCFNVLVLNSSFKTPPGAVLAGFFFVFLPVGFFRGFIGLASVLLPVGLAVSVVVPLVNAGFFFCFGFRLTLRLGLGSNRSAVNMEEEGASVADSEK